MGEIGAGIIEGSLHLASKVFHIRLNPRYFVKERSVCSLTRIDTHVEVHQL